MFAEGDEGCPEIPPNIWLTESDVDRPTEWLKKHVWVEVQQNLGRRPLWLELPRKTNSCYFEVWASSEQEVLRRFPELRSMTLQPMTGHMLNSTTYCTLDDLQNHL